MFEPFDSVRIINLPERRDRRREMMRELTTLGLANDPRVAFFPAIRPAEAGPFSSIGARGCYESHLAILREAVAADRSVLILEDDCAFTPSVHSYEFSGDCDIFYGGYYATDPENPAAGLIFGSHMMGFTATGATKICAYLDALEFEGTHPTIDAAYVWFRRAHPDVRTCFASSTLAVQRSSRSDIADLAFYDRVPLLRDVVGLARRVAKRSL
jgi:glycosyl transferase family 25